MESARAGGGSLSRQFRHLRQERDLRRCRTGPLGKNEMHGVFRPAPVRETLGTVRPDHKWTIRLGTRTAARFAER